MKRCDFCNKEADNLKVLNINSMNWSNQTYIVKMAKDFKRRYPSFRNGMVCYSCKEKYKKKYKLRSLIS